MTGHDRGPVPVTRALTGAEIGADYEAATGRVIVETFAASGSSPIDMPAVLVAHHGVFTWGPDADTAVINAVALELVAGMALNTLALRGPDGPPTPIDEELLERHHRRKHGPTATYGQVS